MIPMSKPNIGASAQRYLSQALKRNEIAQGVFIKEFEARFAKFIGIKHATTAANGTLAVYLALRAIGIGKGDEVLLPSLTFAAPADAVLLTGAKPVFVDTDADSFSLDLASVAKYRTKRTKCILAVDLYGVPCDIKSLRRFKLPIIQDSCESLGAKVGDADITCFSFFGNKVMTTGEGGMACTDSPRYKNFMDRYRNHGRASGYWHELSGINARMSNLTAALGLSQLEDLPANLRQRRKILGWYGFTNPQKVGPWVMWVRRPDKARVVARLNTHKIQARIGFHPLHTMPAYRQKKHLPGAERLGREIVLLPLFPQLTQKEVQYILSKL